MGKSTNEEIGAAIIDVYMAIKRFENLVCVPSYKGGNPPPAKMAEECMKRIWRGESIHTQPLNAKKHLQFLIDMMQICINNEGE
jgi:hypothetical protein